MSLISVINLSYQAGSKRLFEQLSFSIEAQDRIGLVGHNGSGKSTLLNLLLERLHADEGQLHVQRGLTVGCVEQFLPEHLSNTSAREAVLQYLPEAERPLRAYQVDTLLNELGFDEVQSAQSLVNLSGGQKNLVLLACAQIQAPELLLLDEPGNHMDSRAMRYLKRFLQSPKAPAFLMISHDRELLDSVTSRTLWLRDERVYSFDLPYSAAKKALADADAAALQSRQEEEKQIAKLKVSAKRLATWGKVYDNDDLARKAKTMEKRIGKMEAAKTFVSQGSGLSLTVDAQLLKARQLLTVESASIATPGHRVLFTADFFTLKPGDRVALLGVNGCGKSTFIEALISATKQPSDVIGPIRFNPNVRLGYFDQELAEFESPLSIFDWVRCHCQADEEDIKNTLIQWGVSYLDQSRRVNVLSGGEKARLLMLTFQLDQPNLLIMDEPTNHIDLQGKESLERELLANQVSLFFTSHDRRFVETIANRFWWIQNGRLTEEADPNRYFDTLIDHYAEVDSSEPACRQAVTSKSQEMTTDEQRLERIVELETLLAEDQARKAKFQKPKRQAQWQQEIDHLYSLMES